MDEMILLANPKRRSDCSDSTRIIWQISAIRQYVRVNQAGENVTIHISNLFIARLLELGSAHGGNTQNVAVVLFVKRRGNGCRLS